MSADSKNAAAVSGNLVRAHLSATKLTCISSEYVGHICNISGNLSQQYQSGTGDNAAISPYKSSHIDSGRFQERAEQLERISVVYSDLQRENTDHAASTIVNN